jgi:hypothetical protein
VKLPHGHVRRATEKAQLAAESGVDEVYLVDEPLWYPRAIAVLHRSWRRELAFELGLLGVGLAVGLLLGQRSQDTLGSLPGSRLAQRQRHFNAWGGASQLRRRVPRHRAGSRRNAVRMPFWTRPRISGGGGSDTRRVD